jgi:hypothetical protein
MRRGNTNIVKISTLKIDKDLVIDTDWIRAYTRTAIAICKISVSRYNRLELVEAERKDITSTSQYIQRSRRTRRICSTFSWETMLYE